MNEITLKLFFIILPLISCGQNKLNENISGLEIDAKIKIEAEKHFKDSEELKPFNDFLLLYLNSGEIQSFENDSLILETKLDENYIPFKTFHIWKNDSLTINGGFGIWGGVGFGIEVVNNKAKLYHMLSSDDFPQYSYNENDSLIFRLEVPCTETKIIISEIPDSTKKDQIIYGYIEFKSVPFYASSGFANDKEILPRQKIRNNMKLYFKSKQANFPKEE